MCGSGGQGSSVVFGSCHKGPICSPLQVPDHPDLGCILELAWNSSCNGMLTFEHLILIFYSELATFPLIGQIPKQYSSRAWNKVTSAGVVAAG